MTRSPGPKASAHHSQTLPEVLYRPCPLGAYDVTGTVPMCPPGRSDRCGKVPIQVLHRSRPSGVKSSPQG